jgi:uncharacterized membrane protein YhiD involved in acid resistance
MTREEIDLYTSAFVLAGIAVILAIALAHLQLSVLSSIAALIILIVLSHFQEDITNEGE